MFMDINERFSSRQNLRKHYIQHVKQDGLFGNITIKEYEQLADNIQRSEVDNKRLFGYISNYDNNKSYSKYDIETGIYVSYFYKNGEPLTITCYILDRPSKYFNREKKYKVADIPKGL